MRSFIFLITVVSVLTSCNRDRSSAPGPNHKCNIYGLSVLLSQKYTSDEIDSVYIAKYTAGTSFATLLEDTLFTTVAADTLPAGYAIPDTYYPYIMEQGYDYEISLPSTGQVFRVQEILDPPDSMGGSAGNGKVADCYAFIHQYTATGGPTSVVGVWDKQYDYGAYGVVFGK